MEMLNALVRSNPKPIHNVDLNGFSFVVECDSEQLRKGIESLRDKFDNSKDRYGYQYYNGDPDINLTEEEYQENIDKFLIELQKRLDFDYVKKIVEKAKKKKNGTFYKRRVYDEYVLMNAEDNGMGMVDIYKVKYETIDGLTIRLILHRTSEYIKYGI